MSRIPRNTLRAHLWLLPLLASGSVLRLGQQDSGASAPPLAAKAEVAEVPADASQRARELWTALCKATLAPLGAPLGAPQNPGMPGAPAARTPITAFDLSFDGRAWSPQSNDFEIRQRYLAPGWVRRTQKSGREQIRGPDGDWLVDPTTKEKIRLRGKDFEQDRRELGETQQVARSFVALANPGAIRLTRLETMAAPPTSIPTALAARAAQLDWIAIETSSLTRASTNPGAALTLFRAQIGLDKKSALPQIAVVWEEEQGQHVGGQDLLVDLLHYAPLDGYQVPDKLKVYPPDPQRSPLVFAEAPSLQLDLRRGGSLKPALTPEDFVPKP
jgi:hypothetical protein